MRVIVCGSREFGHTKEEQDFIYSILDDLFSGQSVVIISGCARGVDTVALDWAVDTNSQYEEYPAQWDLYGRRAGPLRNIQMLEEGEEYR